jgi:DNA-binding response OmpR family regulator
MDSDLVLKKAKILVVDDDDVIRHLIHDILNNEGHKVVMAEDGEEALDQFNATGFDMVITDLVMPKLNGMQLVKALREKNVKIPIVIVTGWIEEFLPEKETDQVDSIIQKPFTVENLTETLSLVNREEDKESE